MASGRRADQLLRRQNDRLVGVASDDSEPCARPRRRARARYLARAMISVESSRLAGAALRRVASVAVHQEAL
jgi:hypothetical protein